MNITYRNSTKSDSDQIDSLIDNEFGIGYSQTKKVGDRIGLVACVDQKIIGCALALISKGFGILDLIVVDKDYRGNGVGERLFKLRIKMLADYNIHEFVLYHWCREAHEAPKLAIQHGFKLHQVHPEFWRKESKQLQYNCAVCGDECKCSAAEYRLIKKPQNKSEAL